MQPDAVYGAKEYVQMMTYGGIERAPERNLKDEFIRERMDAALSILERIIGQDIEDELQREMDRKREIMERHKQNLMMAGLALEKIRIANGHMLERDFQFISEGKIYRTPYGMVMIGVKEVLEKFWTGE
jgi:hypothetical protein